MKLLSSSSSGFTLDNQDAICHLISQAVPILNTLAPQTGHIPLVPSLLFLIVTFSGFLISLFVLHLKQYACDI